MIITGSHLILQFVSFILTSTHPSKFTTCMHGFHLSDDTVHIGAVGFLSLTATLDFPKFALLFLYVHFLFCVNCLSSFTKLLFFVIQLLPFVLVSFHWMQSVVVFDELNVLWMVLFHSSTMFFVLPLDIVSLVRFSSSVPSLQGTIDHLPSYKTFYFEYWWYSYFATL